MKSRVVVSSYFSVIEKLRKSFKRQKIKKNIFFSFEITSFQTIAIIQPKNVLFFRFVGNTPFQITVGPL